MPVHQPPPAGMTLEDYYYGVAVTVTAPAWRGTTSNPETGIWGLNSLIRSSAFFRALESQRAGIAVTLSLVAMHSINDWNRYWGSDDDWKIAIVPFLPGEIPGLGPANRELIQLNKSYASLEQMGQHGQSAIGLGQNEK